MKKEKNKLNSESNIESLNHNSIYFVEIFKNFTKNLGKSGIVAYYIYNKNISSHLIKELTNKKLENDGRSKVFNSLKEKRENLEAIDLENELKEMQDNQSNNKKKKGVDEPGRCIEYFNEEEFSNYINNIITIYLE
jgi:hypothetical protein